MAKNLNYPLRPPPTRPSPTEVICANVGLWILAEEKSFLQFKISNVSKP